MISRRTPRRMIGPVLLSLALLWAQQAAISHALAHPPQPPRATCAGSETPSKAQFEAHACGDCLAYDQLFWAPGHRHQPLAFGAPGASPLFMPVTPDGCIATVCAYQPRAPPPA